MIQKRKQSKSSKVVIRRRSHINYDRIERTPPPEVPPKKSEPLNINELPVEILLQIFSHLPKKDLHFCIKHVCKRWKAVASDAFLWKIIRVSNDVPTETLSSWIKSSPMLRNLSLTDRNDANAITADISKYAKQLESIELVNCWGSQRSPVIYSRQLCNLVQRCPKLCTFRFADIKFLSCKFFTLMMKNKRNVRAGRKCSYFGPMSAKQLYALLQSIVENNSLENAFISNSLRERIVAVSDIINEMRNSDFVERLWNDLTQGRET